MWKLLSRSAGEPKQQEPTSSPKKAASQNAALSPASDLPALAVPPLANPPSTAESNSHARNRRESTRYTAIKEGLWLGWWSDGDFVVVDAQLVNISAGGVLTWMEKAPTQGQTVWMRLEGTSTRESLAATVLESRWVTLRRRWSVRLEFHHDCPQDFYESAIDES